MTSSRDQGPGEAGRQLLNRGVLMNDLVEHPDKPGSYGAGLASLIFDRGALRASNRSGDQQCLGPACKC
jgi:hypothetical protein